MATSTDVKNVITGGLFPVPKMRNGNDIYNRKGVHEKLKALLDELDKIE